MPNRQTYGLLHRFTGALNLSMDPTGNVSTILPLFGADQNKDATASVINVNPRNDNYAGVQNAVYNYMGSSVYKLRLRLMISIPPAGQETGISSVLYQSGLMLHTWDDLDKTDEAGNTWGSQCQLQFETTTEHTVHPIWNGTDLDSDGSTLPTDVHGLTTDQTPEEVDIGDNFLETKPLRQDEFSGLYKKTFPFGFNDYIVHKDRPFISDNWINVPSSVKAQNKGTFCGIAIKVPESNRQLYASDEVTNVSHLRIGYAVYFTEYNEEFNQAP
jgi:hypothetical protein